MDISGPFDFLKICSKPTYGEVSPGFKVSLKNLHKQVTESTRVHHPLVWQSMEDREGGSLGKRRKMMWRWLQEKRLREPSREGDIHNLGQNFYGDALSGPFPRLLLHTSSAAAMKRKWMARYSSYIQNLPNGISLQRSGRQSLLSRGW